MRLHKPFLIAVSVLLVMTPVSLLCEDKQPETESDVRAESVASLLTGKRVKVFLIQRQILGTVRTVTGTQLYLSNARPVVTEPPTEVVVDTSSGTFEYVQVIGEGTNR